MLKKDSRFTPEMRKKVFKVEKERRKQSRQATSRITELTLSTEQDGPGGEEEVKD